MTSATPDLQPSVPMAWMRQIYQWACTRLYHEFAWAYDPVSAAVSLGRWEAWRLVVLPHVTGKLVVELGCGTGLLLPRLAAPGRSVVGLDASAAMLHQARRRHNLRGALLVRARGQAMPFAQGSVDCFVATFPAPYILAPPTLEAVRHALVPGGFLIVGGLWVAPDGPLRALPLVYGRPDGATLQSLQAMVAEAHMCASWFEVDVTGDRVGVMIVERA